MNKPKLFLVTPMLHQGGFERVCINTARLMADQFDIYIIIFDDRDIAFDIDGLNIINLDLGVKTGKISRLINVRKRVNALKKLKKEYKPEVCYSFGLTANLVNAMSKTSDTKVWLGIRASEDVTGSKRIGYFSKRADLVICCSKEIERLIIDKYPTTKTDILYNPFDIKKITEEANGEPEWPWEEVDEDGRKLRILVSMGRDDSLKCFWHMIKAFKIVHDEIPEARLAILGDGSFERNKRLVNDLGINKFVYFAGMRKDPYKYLKKAEIYLLTSRSEGFPNAIVEGMCLGLAPVSTDCVSGPKEILEDGKYGILVPVMSIEENYDAADLEEEKQLADEIISLLQDDEKLDSYRKNAVIRAKDFSYEIYHNNYMRIYGENS